MMALMGLRYTLLLLIIPAYLIALSRRRWTTIPLWLVSISIVLTQFALSAPQSALPGGSPQPSAFVYLGEMTKILLVPIAVQFAVTLSGMAIGVGNQATRRRRKLMEPVSVGMR